MQRFIQTQKSNSFVTQMQEVLAIKISYDEILADPESFAKKATDAELIDLIEESADAYYNTDENLFPDYVFDAFQKELLSRKSPKGQRVAKQIGAPVPVERKGKVKLPYYLPSLDKLKDQDQLERWGARYNEDFIVSDKIDGVSLLIVAEEGEYQLFTRGNGKIGQDVSAMASLLKLPKRKNDFVVRAEVVMPASLFKTKYAKIAENPRNMVSGLVNRTGGGKELKDVSILAYELIEPSGLKPSMQFKKLKALGFETPPWRRFSRLDEAELLQLASQQKSGKFEIDGLVITPDVKYRRTTAGNPPYSVAFKSTAMNPEVLTTVERVEWNHSKNGYLKPRVEIKPVKLGGATIRWATGFNFKFIKENKIGPGARIKIIRSGDVIPKITEVVQPARTAQLPQEDYELTPTGVDAILVEDDRSPRSTTVQAKKILFFLVTMGVEGIKLTTVQKMINEGWEDLYDFIDTKEDELLDVPGFSGRSAEKLYRSLQKAIWPREGVDLATLMTATGFFGTGVGSRRLEQVAIVAPNLLNMSPSELRDNLYGRSGFSRITVDKISKGLKPFQEFVRKTGLEIKQPKAPKRTGNALSGQVIVFTGFRSAELEEAINNNGGSVGSSVTRATTLVVYRGARISGKLRKAQDQGIAVMPEGEFIESLERQGII